MNRLYFSERVLALPTKQQAPPPSHLSITVTLLGEVDVLAILAVHGQGGLSVVVITVLLELEGGHAVKQLGEVARHDGGVVAVGQDVQQVSRRHEVEPAR